MIFVEKISIRVYYNLLEAIIGEMVLKLTLS